MVLEQEWLIQEIRFRSSWRAGSRNATVKIIYTDYYTQLKFNLSLNIMPRCFFEGIFWEGEDQDVKWFVTKLVILKVH